MKIYDKLLSNLKEEFNKNNNFFSNSFDDGFVKKLTDGVPAKKLTMKELMENYKKKLPSQPARMSEELNDYYSFLDSSLKKFIVEHNLQEYKFLDMVIKSSFHELSDLEVKLLKHDIVERRNLDFQKVDVFTIEIAVIMLTTHYHYFMFLCSNKEDKLPINNIKEYLNGRL
ncbi:hypothetical protein SAMN04489735_100243 [Aneurinibacillus thermoaerophilus]|uniref:Uncharacterized protein n=1 Tax=Aneurinibacillus thermoaerophilus TaxID=143495 RepID=A0A1G7WPD0_ANETH|nr:hypothetical protein [Aneurinibacillus thermoaerophilus]SDG73782.1 hypothetical protein SAMN04489735_100243 [Aneurinibacillus thermoaerophilus]